MNRWVLMMALLAVSAWAEPPRIESVEMQLKTDFVLPAVSASTLAVPLQVFDRQYSDGYRRVIIRGTQFGRDPMTLSIGGRQTVSLPVSQVAGGRQEVSFVLSGNLAQTGVYVMRLAAFNTSLTASWNLVIVNGQRPLPPPVLEIRGEVATGRNPFEVEIEFDFVKDADRLVQFYILENEGSIVTDTCNTLTNAIYDRILLPGARVPTTVSVTHIAPKAGVTYAYALCPVFPDTGVRIMHLGRAVSGAYPRSKVLFATSRSDFHGNLGGLAGADATCAGIARQAKMPLVANGSGWKALLTDKANDSFDRLGLTGSLLNSRGEVLMQSAQNLITEAVQPTRLLTEDGQSPDVQSAPAFAFTGAPGVARRDDCNGWTSNSGSAVGSVGILTGSPYLRNWSSSATLVTCAHNTSQTYRLYCVGDTDVPAR